MPVEILMPELGESVHEGTVSRWLKAEGEFVEEDEPVVEIMTDKVNTELPAPASGILSKILIPEGGQVEVFHAMGVIEEQSAGAAKPKEPVKPEPESAPIVARAEPAAPVTPQPPAPPAELLGKRWYTPVVRAMAKQHGISENQLAALHGSGEGGRVTKRDVEALIAGGAKSVANVPAAPSFQERPVVEVSGPEQEVVQLSALRKMIAEAMVRSSQVPTVSTVVQVDVTAMVHFRERNKDEFQETYGVKLTYTPFFIKALTESLQEFPLVNSSLQADNTVQLNRAVHMGVAVALGLKGDEGLIVPVVRNCHKKGLIEIARELDEIARKARSNSLSVADVQGGTFTLTNPGSYGALFGTPMINAPQAGIAGAYGIQKLPVIVNDMIAIRSMMYLVLTYDHRLVDGLLAGRFLASVRERLQAFDFFK